jgi:hypothetical protein
MKITNLWSTVPSFPLVGGGIWRESCRSRFVRAASSSAIAPAEVPTSRAYRRLRSRHVARGTVPSGKYQSPSAIEASRNSFPRTTAHVAGGRSRTSSGYWSLAGAASCPRRLTAMRDAGYTEQVHLIRVTCRNGQSWIFLSCSINFLPLPIRIDDHEKQI